jgi:peptidyl-tRNA hydrolase, PTH1 family
VKLIVGLGNPGDRYAATRHNVGFAVADALAARHRLAWEAAPRGIAALVARWREQAAVVAKPLTFMNLSGQAVVALRQFYKVEPAALLVVVDEVQLELGRLRARPDGSAGGHNGLQSIADALGSGAFARLRIGVGRGDGRRDLADHVLARFEPGERDVVAAAIGRAADACELFLAEGIQPVMNRFNRKDERADGDGKRNGEADAKNGKRDDKKEDGA